MWLLMALIPHQPLRLQSVRGTLDREGVRVRIETRKAPGCLGRPRVCSDGRRRTKFARLRADRDQRDHQPVAHPNVAGMPEVVRCHQSDHRQPMALGDKLQTVTSLDDVDDVTGRGGECRCCQRSRRCRGSLGQRRGDAGKHTHPPCGRRAVPGLRRPRFLGQTRARRDSGLGRLSQVALPNDHAAAHQGRSRTQYQDDQSRQHSPASHRSAPACRSPVPVQPHVSHHWIF